ncbi:peroxisomal leader peptide-processing protease [Elgaria multicarinata webbii]|uniref:peroxisomal leader peptide-processing protease n=1 Tax=Elgaria multicarinata webbii TaxID=159646 RepID=UPI002FCD3B9F
MAEAPRLTAEDAGCIVRVSPAPAPADETRRPSPQGPWSGSGVVLSQAPGLVLCHGTIFSPFLLAAERQNWPRRKVLLADSFLPDLQIQVLLPGECSSSSSRTPSRNWPGKDTGDNIPVLRFNPLSNLHKTPSSLNLHQAQLLVMAPCLQFQDAFSQVFRASDQWHFGGDEAGQESGSSLADDLPFLHCFALLRILGCDFPRTGRVSCATAQLLRKGDPVFTCGSPFGSFCPDIFMNTLSKGIVSNTAGEGNALILTDARCLPGTEGGGVYMTSGIGFHLVGIIVAPLCWKSTEWVGLTLVCAIDRILESIGSILSGPRWCLKSWTHPMELVTTPRGMMVAREGLDQQMLAAVVLVECGPIWGSGVLVNSRLVLTCRHVVHGASSVCVRLQPSPEKASIAKGKVVFATKDSSPYDVALVELEESLSTFAVPVLASKFRTGEDVTIVGFGVFGRACGPSLTSGILSSVVAVHNEPVMLQATCAVHGGSSGGALFATHSGKLLGIVASNTRDNSIGVTYPHLNFSIPITVLQPAILEYICSRSLHGFRELDRVDDRVQVVWRLQKEPVEIPLSKL